MLGAAQYASAAARALMRLEERPGPLDTPCWIWPGACSTGGYGYIRVGGREGKSVTVHAVLDRALTGRRLRRGQLRHHLCEVPLCANPAHVEHVTRRQHGRRHRRDLAPCGHPYDLVMGKRKVRRCRRCRNKTRRARYAAGGSS